ncbi:MAG: Smr/MutS family protein [Myxococcaceae bacterium]|nr:Smr/MutS family protein [Myxococcaceae bacterium]
MGKARALARPFLPGADEVLASYQLIGEARALKHEPLSLPLGGLTDVRTNVDRAHRGALLEPKDLIAITHVLFAFEKTLETLRARRERLPTMLSLAQAMPELEKVATRLDRSFDPSGEISDRASPALRDARDHARGLHRTIKGRLDRMLHDEKFASNLREGYYSVRNDRYVVPVMSSSRSEVPGIVHNASQSGQTLFVEPQDLIGLGNDLAIAQSLVLEEERRVLIELSGDIGRNATAIIRGVDAAAVLDEAEGIARLADELQCTFPELQPSGGTLDLKGLRHPLLVLQGTQVVPNEVTLHDESKALVVSGPNAGGKTVTLTGVGLSALMARAGLPIPVDEGSKMPLFDAVHSSIGDAQSLKEGLSTFSAHVAALRDIVASAKRGSLVLVDEIAADTDPREGAAIAIAVLEDLIQRGALVLVTTHLEELKALAHLDQRFVNARVGFDSRKMAPTFRLQLGQAGASSAIEIARRVGLPDALCARASELAQNAGGALSKALAAAQDEQRRLWEARDAAEKQAREAEALREKLEAEVAALTKKRRDEEAQFRTALKAELEYARTQVRELLEKLEAAQSLKDTKAAAKELAARIDEQTVATKALRPAPAELPLELKVGGKARHKGLDAEVEVLEVDGDHVTVQAGALKMRVKVSELAGSRTARAAAAAPSKPAPKVEEVKAAVLTLAAPKLDVRGERAEEALRQLERFLDRAARDGEAAALVVHGHGTGALKTSVREYLEASPYASSFRPGDSHEGGDGVTVVSLR